MPLLSRKNKHSNEHMNEQGRRPENQAQGQAGMGDPNMNKPLPGQSQQDPRFTQQNMGQQDFQGQDPFNRNTSSTGASTGTGGANPPASSGNRDQGHGGGQSMTNKVESAVGSMVGSNALKAKGMQKRQEADSIHQQSQELAEAERLEHEALVRRDHAVSHGAHPQNKHLGGDANAAVLQPGTGRDMGGAGARGFDQQGGATGAGNGDQAGNTGYGAPGGDPGAGGMGPRV
ncbi:hypothetical protein CONPUDRAFT_167609 [Coniophora puteana RWD-64-598 SS2]|uniref:CsbD-like domain-containing protein n=1 Tax=Coniophora puteana (strain RWD-64-598) TaxID=741705 RepID=A0A5M3MHR1_CONPW|nr:uncharacterized protein CONPUDRAFT_167609 [Coniophora puteana RWD-64-598 SS2]EIW78643.1 hypothetical protein CONPUDRAFT_167609 [Coniophora puteana RWD-64-598 SS2]